jgi:hypothetical protein
LQNFAALVIREAIVYVDIKIVGQQQGTERIKTGRRNRAHAHCRPRSRSLGNILLVTFKSRPYQETVVGFRFTALDAAAQTDLVTFFPFVPLGGRPQLTTFHLDRCGAARLCLRMWFGNPHRENRSPQIGHGTRATLRVICVCLSTS